MQFVSYLVVLTETNLALGFLLAVTLFEVREGLLGPKDEFTREIYLFSSRTLSSGASRLRLSRFLFSFLQHENILENIFLALYLYYIGGPAI